jgi:hypothetical protein
MNDPRQEQPTDEHGRPVDAEDPTQAGRPRPASGPIPLRPQQDQPPAPPQPPAAPPQPAAHQPPYPAAPGYTMPPPPPPPPQQSQYPYAGQPQPQPYVAPQPTVQGGDGTLWLRPESSVQPPLQSPAPPASYLGAPTAQPYPTGRPYPGYPMVQPGPVEPGNGKATASLVLGIVGLTFLFFGAGLFFCWISLPCSILAWIFGPLGKRDVDEGKTTRGDGAAKAGFWMGLVGTIVGVLALAAWIVGFAVSG